MSQNQQKGISSVANLARLGHAVATVLQGAVSGGLHGAAVAAAKAFLPEIIKAIFYLILFCVFIPFFLYLSVVHPNFQYPHSAEQHHTGDERKGGLCRLPLR